MQAYEVVIFASMNSFLHCHCALFSEGLPVRVLALIGTAGAAAFTYNHHPDHHHRRRRRHRHRHRSPPPQVAEEEEEQELLSPTTIGSCLPGVC